MATFQSILPAFTYLWPLDGWLPAPQVQCAAQMHVPQTESTCASLLLLCGKNNPDAFSLFLISEKLVQHRAFPATCMPLPRIMRIIPEEARSTVLIVVLPSLKWSSTISDENATTSFWNPFHVLKHLFQPQSCRSPLNQWLIPPDPSRA